MKFKLFIAVAALLVVFIALAGCLGPGGTGDSKTAKVEYSLMEGAPWEESGYCGDPQNGNQPSTQTVNLELMEGMFTEIVFTLVWQDDEPRSDPDEFRLEVSGQAGGSVQTFSESSSSGTISIAVKAEGFTLEGFEGDPDALLGGSWDVTVSALSCGTSPRFPIGPGIIFNEPDQGNEWELIVENVHVMGMVKGGGGSASDFTLTDTNGNTVSLSDYSGKVVVLDLMMDCGACVDQAKSLKALKDRFGPSVALISVDIDPSDTEDDVARIKEERNADWPFAKDTDDLISKYQVQGMRKLVVINKNRDITFASDEVVGSGELASEVESALEGKASPISLGSKSIFPIAFITGITAFFAPCAFPMLPGYITYYLSAHKTEGPQQEENVPGSKRDLLIKGLFTGAVTALGIGMVYIVIGILLSVFGIPISILMGFLAPFIALLVILIGITFILGWHSYYSVFFYRFRKATGLQRLSDKMELGKRLSFLTLDGTGAEKKKGYRGLFLYGVGYAGASTGCHGVAFISIVLIGLSSAGFLGAMMTSLLWVAGMVLIMVIVTVMLSFAKFGFVSFITKNINMINRITGVLLVLAGIIIIAYEFLL